MENVSSLGRADRPGDRAPRWSRQARCAGHEVSVAVVDVSSRESVHALVAMATGMGDIVGLIHAGVSPSQASPETILHVDL